MIKIGTVRFNPDEIWSYYPCTAHGKPAITFVRRHATQDEDVTFETDQQRDETLEAMDQLFLMIDNGRIVERNLDMPPFVIGEDELGGLGGINLQ